MNTKFNTILSDLMLLRVFPRRYGTPIGRGNEYWMEVSADYADYEKKLLASDFRWKVITYDDGREELAYLRVLKGGMLSGIYPAIYRGLIIPRRIELGTWARIKKIRTAF